MNLLEALQPYLYSSDDTISAEFDAASYRLNAEEKRQIEAAIAKNGVDSLKNVTKGGAMLYLRSAMRFSGDDEGYLRHLFAPHTLVLHPWRGAEQIELGVVDSGKVNPKGQRIQIVRATSPFVERYYRLPYMRMSTGEKSIVGYRFMAMPWRKNRLKVLQQHGRIECLPKTMLPVIADEPWQGGWIPILASQVEVNDWQSMSSDIGQIPVAGGDYLAFLIMAKAIGAAECSYQEKLELLKGMDVMCGSGGHFFDLLIEKIGGFGGLLQIMQTECGEE